MKNVKLIKIQHQLIAAAGVAELADVVIAFEVVEDHSL